MSTRPPKLALLLCVLVWSACGRVGIDLQPFTGEGGVLPADDAALADGSTPDAAALACMRDSDGDGIRDCDDTCGGSDDTRYVPITSCGLGFCRTNSTPSSCVGGRETACVPGAPRSASDATCDGVDDNCDGAVDEDYAPVMACGVGACRTRSTPSRCSAGVEIACQPASPLRANDPTSDGVDDDCDGMVDEEVCVPSTLRVGAGMVSTSAGTCTRLSVRLWGAGGASGDAQGGYWGAAVTGGAGGAGGYAEQTFSVSESSTIRVYVGEGARACATGGRNVQTAYNGGAGASALAANGSAGSDGTIAGGAGARPSAGGNGGNGSLGGGGGGAGAGPGFAPFGSGGGGGAASVALVDGARLIVGGGGGGGGAGTNVATVGLSGGAGGSGCSGTGGAGAASEGGGGGGGGVCQGASEQQRGTGRMPYDPASELPANAARGGSTSGDCQAGGDGYAIITLSP